MLAPQVTPQQVYARIGLETGLLGDTFQKRRSPALLVGALCGIRCEKLEQAHLVLASRFPDYEPDMLLRALHERRTLVRTWGVRGVLQIVPTTLMGLFLGAAGLTAPRWRRFLDARSSLATPARLRLIKRLGPEEISRDSMREAIPDANTRLFMLREAAQAGHIVWKEGDGQQAVYVWTKKWLGKTVEPERDYFELIGRYLTTYGPLEAADLANWLGVTVAAARKLMAKHLVEEVTLEGLNKPLFMKAEDLEALVKTRKSRAKGTMVIPPGDPMLMAYKGGSFLGAYEEDDGVVIEDGRRVATWTLNRGVVSVRHEGSENPGAIEDAIAGVVERAGIAAALEVADN